MPSVGPELLPHLMKRKRSVNDDDEPSQSPPTKIHAASPDSQQHQRRIAGPAPPPASFLERPDVPADEESESDEDEDFGPSLPPSATSDAEHENTSQDTLSAAPTTQEEKPQKPQREDWMLAPPTDADWSSRIDPTRLKSRKFASGRNARGISTQSGVSAIWTETPEQKRQRLEDEVLGRKEPSTFTNSATKSKKDKAEAEATARRIKEYNEKNRGRSLYEEHKQSIGLDKEDDPSQRAFDKEKDMSLGRLGSAEKRDMLKKAASFGGRFERGSFL